MKALERAISIAQADLCDVTARLGQRVDFGGREVLDRSAFVSLGPPGSVSPNRSCRLISAADGWIAVNLPRQSDLDLIPAWLNCEWGAEPWEQVEKIARERSCARLVEDARILALPVSRALETKDAQLPELPPHNATRRRERLEVLDLSSLWAGPLCGSQFAATGASVTKIESQRRPDPTRNIEGFHRRLNGQKAEMTLDFTTPTGRLKLRDLMLAADVVISSARMRAFDQMELSPDIVFAANPDLLWIAISGYGWRTGQADRVAFGDDAAAAGGLLAWNAEGEPRFTGDALADPLTGLAAACLGFRAIDDGKAGLIDLAMADVAACAARGYVT